MKYFLSLLAILFTTLSAYSFYDSYIGKYQLYFPYQSSWNHHTMNIDSIEGTKIRGRLSLDFGMGNEAREPKSWEKIHNIPFEGRYNSKTQGVKFAVYVELPDRVHYAFQGHLMKARGKRYLSGSYYIHKIKQGGFIAIK